MMNRRDFLKSALTLVALSPIVRFAPGLSAANNTVGKDSYDFFMTSDAHLGDPESYREPRSGKHLCTKKDPKRAQKAMPLFEAMFKQIAAESSSNTAFMIECGDLIEGGSFNADTHSEQLQKAFDLMAQYFKYPIYPANGNHDGWGMGGQEAINRVFLPHVQKITGKSLKTYANYSFWYGKDFYIVLDYFTGWDKSVPKSNYIQYAIDELAKVKKSGKKPRYVFVSLHPNVMPWPSGRDKKLRDALLPYDGIILCGHSHSTLLLEYSKGGHKVTQFSIGTCISPMRGGKNPNVYTGVTDDVDRYRESFIKQRCTKNGKQIKAKVDDYDKDYKPYITRAWAARGQGYARFIVSDSGIKMLVQSADLNQKPFELKIR